jgi:predicted DNA-binding antitoxin AbrB/MazE fold protein
MTMTVEAVYENGLLKPIEPLALQEHEKVRLTIQQGDTPLLRAYGIMAWTGSTDDLDYLIEDDENDPLEAP